jgi:hypothetical protein
MLRIKCYLEFNADGSVAELRTLKGLSIARFGVRGPFMRNAEQAMKGYEDTFAAEVRGIADYQYIDDHGETQMVKRF